PTRRAFLARSAAVATLGALRPSLAGYPEPRLCASEPGSARPRPANRVGTSTYSYCHFGKNPHDLRDVEKCLDLAADMGFDGVEILQQQLTDQSPGYLQRLKRRAFKLGLDLMGFSTHQTFKSPNKSVRQKTV